MNAHMIILFFEGIVSAASMQHQLQHVSSVTEENNIARGSADEEDGSMGSNSETSYKGTADVHTCLMTYASRLDQVHHPHGRNLGERIRALSKRIESNHGTRPESTVFVVGFGSTGTTSMATALSMVGLTGYHYGPTNKGLQARMCNPSIGLFEDWTYTKDFLADTPLAEIFIDLFVTFPNAKFILTDRPPMSWIPARLKRFTGSNCIVPTQKPCDLGLASDFNTTDLAYLFGSHPDLVKCVVPRDRLFEVNFWEDSSYKMEHMMANLAAFVGRPSSAQSEMPHENQCWGCNKARLVSIGDNTSACPSEKFVASAFQTGDTSRVSLSPDQMGIFMQRAAKEDCELQQEEEYRELPPNERANELSVTIEMAWPAPTHE
jgi:hypothetical protein